ncbi:MAG: MarR family transcriptional regulator [Anaerolineae bacterium]|nr:MarR family transcriptional regulator [Anaerolineae bacterium]
MSTHYQGTETERIALDAYIKLSRAADAVSVRINHHLKELNLTISQFGVLEALYHLGSLHQNELGEKILKTSGNMTLVIDNLVKRGLVCRERDEDDRRFITIHLTEVGYNLIHELFPRHVRVVVQEMGALTQEEQIQLATLCRKIGLSDPV